MGDFDNHKFLFISDVFIKDIDTGKKKKGMPLGSKTMKKKKVILKCDNCNIKKQNEKFKIVFGIENYNFLNKSVLFMRGNNCCQYLFLT